MSATRPVIAALYAQVSAPAWARPNLDGLADVLRDLSWLPAGPVDLVLPDLADLGPDDRRSLLQVLARAVEESVEAARPVRVRPRTEGGESGPPEGA